MSHYRRSNIPGASYFFTVVTYRRQPILCQAPIRNALRQALVTVRKKWPFSINAWVLLPDHLHCIWTLPLGDADFSTRWSIIKRQVSLTYATALQPSEWLPKSKRLRRESNLWQRRFWEHKIRDEMDFRQHVDYIHHNPMKHGLCSRVVEWPYSTFHRYVTQGVYPMDWAGSDDSIVTAGE